MILDDLKLFKNFSGQEQLVSDYILSQPSCVLTMTCKELAEATFTSSANIIRFCKKLNFSGYQDFRLQYIKEYSLTIADTIAVHSTKEINSYDDIPTLVYKIYMLSIDNAKSRLDVNKLRSVARKITNSTRLDIYGLGSRFNIASKYSYKFQSIGINAMAKNTLDFHQLVKEEKNTSVISIFLSNSGENKVLIDYINILKKYNYYICSITGIHSNKIAILSNDFFYVDTGLEIRGLGSIFFQTSAEYILDVIFVMVILMNSTIKENVSLSSDLFTFDKL